MIEVINSSSSSSNTCPTHTTAIASVASASGMGNATGTTSSAVDLRDLTSRGRQARQGKSEAKRAFHGSNGTLTSTWKPYLNTYICFFTLSSSALAFLMTMDFSILFPIQSFPKRRVGMESEILDGET